MIKKLTSLLFAFAIALSTFSQIVYDFENFDLSNWTQSQADHFSISSTEQINGIASLHHSYDNSSSGHDQISLPINLDLSKGTTVWKFKIRHGYNPSSSNNWGVILCSDKDAPSMTKDSLFSGYAIGVDMMKYSDDTLKLFRIDNGNPVPVIKTSINWQNTVGTNRAASIVVTRNSSGNWQIYFSLTNDYDSLSLVGYGSEQTYTYAKYFGIYYEYTSSQDQKLWFDDLQIYAMYSQNNATFSDQNITDTILATSTNQPGTELEKIKFYVPASDTAPALIKQIILIPTTNNQISDWSELFDGIMFNFNQTNITGIINKNTLVFNLNLTIQPGDSLQGTISAWLKNKPKATDNDKFGFSLSDAQIICDPTKTGFTANQTSDNQFVYSIKATKLVFEQVPICVKPSKNFYLKVIATDESNNQDLDANFPVTLSLNTGTGTLASTSGLTKNLTNGTVEWNDLTYSSLDKFRITAFSQSLGGFLSPYIQGNTYLYFLKDDFEDGDISDWIESEQGHWSATDNEPLDGNFSLSQTYDNDQSATEWIAHRLSSVDISDTTVIWKFALRYGYSSPSSSNNWNVVLMADQNPIETSDFNGYAVGINWNTTNDLLTLWKINNGTISAIGSSNFNYDTQTQAGQIIYFYVTRTVSGNWTLEINTSQGNSPQTIATATDNQFTQANYFAVRYQYTSSQDQKLTLDDIYFGQPIPDTIPPIIDTALAISPDTVLVYFNEPIKIADLTPANFSIDDTINIKAVAKISSQIIKLTLEDTLTENILHTLTAVNISDITGNTASQLKKTLKWTALYITQITFPDTASISIYFNRPIDTSTVNLRDFALTPFGGKISKIDKYPTHLTLSLSTALTRFEQYSLSNTQITDAHGNKIKNIPFSFDYYIPRLGDLVLNEIMFDISPAPPALPANKYIELYNRTGAQINLYGWQLQIGDHIMTIDNPVIIKPLSFVIITSTQAQDYFRRLAPVAQILNETYLTTSGKTVKLVANNGQIIDQITYSPAWYNDPDKDNGGWAIERIDPNNLCNQDINWHASQNPIGGTPGFQNSVLASNPDTTLPYITNIQAVSANTLKITLNKTISPQSLAQQINFVLNGEVTPLTVSTDPQDVNTLILNFLVSFNDGQNTLLVHNLTDHCNNTMLDTTLSFIYHKIHATGVEPISQNEIKVYFSEPVEQSSAQQDTNYFVNFGIGNPFMAARDNQDPSVVYLIFSKNFALDTTYTISIAHINDLNDNQCDSTALKFTPHMAQTYDIVFNEFMTDVNPSPAGLPPVKYIELFNTKNFDIWLTDWTLTINDKTYRLPNRTIAAHGFLVLTGNGSSISNALPILSSNYIKTNANYSLFSSKGQIIDFVPLSEKFWGNQPQNMDGISAEKINPYLTCETTENWTSSQSPAGGTPNSQNSVFNTQNQAQPLDIISRQPENAFQLSLTLSRPVLNPSVTDTLSYSVNSSSIKQAQITNYQQLTLTAADEFRQGNNKIKISITDDCGNNLDKTLKFEYQFIHIKQIIPIDSNMLKVIFSEPPAKNIFDKQNYVLNKADYPDKIIISQQNRSEIYLYFNTKFQTGLNTIEISKISDAYGNQIPDFSQQFTYYLPSKDDIAINELLFDPYPGCAKYIEIYNKTDFPIDLRSLALANITDSTIDNLQNLSSTYQTIGAHQYLCITTDTANVKATYPTHGSNFLQIKSLPSLPSTQGNIALVCKDSIIDYFEYSNSMHSSLIHSDQGVALERISFDLPTNSTDNWTSAAQTVGFGTPAMKNSQYKSIDSLISVSANLSLSDKTISPDQDGIQDNMIIKLTTQENNLYADIKITNKWGRPIKTLADNTLLGTDNTFIWDGTDKNGQIVQPGIYVIIAKIYSTSGRTKIIKKAIAVTKRGK